MVGSYELVRCLDTAGTSAVYLGEHPEILSKVAIKVLAPELSSEAEVVKRFLDEARAQNRIGHPGIVPINDCDTKQDVGLFLVMEYVEGRTLAEEFGEAGRLSAQRTADIARQAASALGAAHAAGIVHRKLKPTNIIMAPDPDLPSGERVRIFGFGIAKLVEESESLDEATKTGIALGFPRYISPEQCLDAKSVDQRTDVYSLGAICYEMLCGRPPYEAETFGHMVIKQETTEPPAPRALEATIPAALEQVVVKAIQKYPKDRYQDMKALRAALDQAVPQGKARPGPKPSAPARSLPKPGSTPVARATAILDTGEEAADAADRKPLWSEERKTAILDPGPGQPDSSPGVAEQDTVIQGEAGQETILDPGPGLADQETLIQASGGEETLVEQDRSLADQETLIQPDEGSLADEETQVKDALPDQETLIKGPDEGIAGRDTMIHGGGNELAGRDTIIKQETRDTGSVRAVEAGGKSRTGLVLTLVVPVVLGLAAVWYFTSVRTGPVAPAPLPPAAGAPPVQTAAPPPPAEPAPPPAGAAAAEEKAPEPGNASSTEPPADVGAPAASDREAGPAADTTARPESSRAPAKKGKRKKRRPRKKKGPYFRDL